MEVRPPPLELERMIFEYIIQVLRDDPQDLINHAADYFNHLRDEMKPAYGRVTEGSREYIKYILGKRATRRSTVMGEGYDPELDNDIQDIEISPKTDEEKKRIKCKCNDVFLFRVLDKPELDAIVDGMQSKFVENGQIIIRQGEDGDYFYLIDSGKFTAEIQNDEGKINVVYTYEDEGYFGELALLYNQPRAATVTATSDGLLWLVSRKTFNKLLVRRAFEKRKSYMKLLREVPQLQPLSEYDKMHVADALSRRIYLPNEVIFKEGEKGDGMYFIIEGTVSVRQEIATNTTFEDEIAVTEISRLGKGGYFGELALITNNVRAETVVAIEDTEVAFLETKAYERLLGPCVPNMTEHSIIQK